MPPNAEEVWMRRSLGRAGQLVQPNYRPPGTVKDCLKRWCEGDTQRCPTSASGPCMHTCVHTHEHCLRFFSIPGRRHHDQATDKTKYLGASLQFQWWFRDHHVLVRSRTGRHDSWAWVAVFESGDSPCVTTHYSGLEPSPGPCATHPCKV